MYHQKVPFLSNQVQLPTPSASQSSSTSSRLQTSNVGFTKEYYRKALGNVNSADSYNPQTRVNTTNNIQSSKQSQLVYTQENAQIPSSLTYSFNSNNVNNIPLSKNQQSSSTSSDQMRAQQQQQQITSAIHHLPPQAATRPSNLNIIIKKDTTNKDLSRGSDNFFSARESVQQNNKALYSYQQQQQQILHLNENPKRSIIIQKSKQDELATSSSQTYKPVNTMPSGYQQNLNTLQTYHNQNSTSFPLTKEITSFTNHMRQGSSLTYQQTNFNTNTDIKSSIEIQGSYVGEKKESILFNRGNINELPQERKNSVYYQFYENLESENNQNNISTYRNLYLEQQQSFRQQQQSSHQQNSRNSSLLVSQKCTTQSNYQPQSSLQQQSYYQQYNNSNLPVNCNTSQPSQREHITSNQSKYIPYPYKQEEENESSFTQTSSRASTNILQHQTKKLLQVVSNGKIDNQQKSQQNYFQQLQIDTKSQSNFATQLNNDNTNDLYGKTSTLLTINTNQPNSRRASIKQDNPLNICELAQSGQWGNTTSISNVANINIGSTNNVIQIPGVGENSLYQAYTYVNPPKVIRQRHKTTINQQEQNIRNYKTSTNNLSNYQQTAQTNRSYDIITNNNTLENSFMNEITPTSTRSIQQYQLMTQQYPNHYYQNQQYTQNSSSIRVSQNFNQLNQFTENRVTTTRKETENLATEVIQNFYYNQESITKQGNKNYSYNKDYNTSKVEITNTLTSTSNERKMYQNENIVSGVKNGGMINQQVNSYLIQTQQATLNNANYNLQSYPSSHLSNPSLQIKTNTYEPLTSNIIKDNSNHQGKTYNFLNPQENQTNPYSMNTDNYYQVNNNFFKNEKTMNTATYQEIEEIKCTNTYHSNTNRVESILNYNNNNDFKQHDNTYRNTVHNHLDFNNAQNTSTVQTGIEMTYGKKQNSLSINNQSNNQSMMIQEKEKNLQYNQIDTFNQKANQEIKHQNEDFKLTSDLPPNNFNKFTGIRKSSKSAYLQSTKTEEDITCTKGKEKTQQENIQENKNIDINSFSFKQKRNSSIICTSNNTLTALESECATTSEHQIPNESKQIKINLKSQPNPINCSQNNNSSSYKNLANNMSGNITNINNNSSNNPLKVSVCNKRKSSKSFIQQFDLKGKKPFGEDQNTNNNLSKQQQASDNLMKQDSNGTVKTRGFNTQLIKNLLLNVNESKSLSNSSRQANLSKNSNFSKNNTSNNNISAKNNLSSTHRVSSNNSRSNIITKSNRQLLLDQILNKQPNTSVNVSKNFINSSLEDKKTNTRHVQQTLNEHTNSNFNKTQTNTTTFGYNYNNQNLIRNLSKNENYNNYQSDFLSIKNKNEEQIENQDKNNLDINRISFHCNNPYIDSNTNDHQKLNENLVFNENNNEPNHFMNYDQQGNYTIMNQNYNKDLLPEQQQQFNHQNFLQQNNNNGQFEQISSKTIITNNNETQGEKNNYEAYQPELNNQQPIQSFSVSGVQTNQNYHNNGTLSTFLSKNNSKKQINSKQNSSLSINQNQNEVSHNPKGNNSSLIQTINNLLNNLNETQTTNEQTVIKRQESSKSSRVRNSIQFMNVLSSKNSQEDLNNYCSSNGTSGSNINNINQTNKPLQQVSKSLKGSFMTANQPHCNTTREHSSSNQQLPTSTSNICLEDELNKQKKRLADQEIKLSQLQEIQKQSKPIQIQKNTTKPISKSSMNSQRSFSEYEYRQNLIPDVNKNGQEIVNKIQEKCNIMNEKACESKQMINTMTFCNKQQQNELSNLENSYHGNDENVPPSYLNQQVFNTNNSNQVNNLLNGNPIEKFQQKHVQKQINKAISIPHMAASNQISFTDNNVFNRQPLPEQSQNPQIIKSSSLALCTDSVSPFSQPYSSTTTTSPKTISSPSSVLNNQPNQQGQQIQVSFRQHPPALTIEEQIQLFDLEEKFKKNENNLKSLEEIQYLIEQEYQYLIDYNYLLKSSSFTPKYRCSLVDWMQRQCMKFYLKRETIHKAIYYFDLFLSRTPTIREDQLYLIAISCIFIAAKQEEIYPPSLNDILSGSQYASQKNIISQQEIKIIECLNWKLNPITGCFWLDLAMAQWDKQQETLCCNLYFRVREESSYRRYREAYQILDCLLLDSNKMKYSLRLLSITSLYLVICKHQGVNPTSHNNQIDQMISNCDYFSMFQVSSPSVKECSKECIQLSQNILFEYELPNAIQQNNFNQRSYEEFLAFQSYTSTNKQAIEALQNQNKI